MGRDRITSETKRVMTYREKFPNGFTEFYLSLLNNDLGGAIEDFMNIRSWGDVYAGTALKAFGKIMIEMVYEEDKSPKEDSPKDSLLRIMEECKPVDQHMIAAIVNTARLHHWKSFHTDEDPTTEHFLEGIVVESLDKTTIGIETRLEILELFEQISKK